MLARFFDYSMFRSVASELQSQQPGQHGAIAKNEVSPANSHVLSPLIFPHGSRIRILPSGRYLVNLSICEGSEHLCFDTVSGEQLSCKVYELGEFHSKAHLLLKDCWGVCSPQDVCVKCLSSTERLMETCTTS